MTDRDAKAEEVALVLIEWQDSERPTSAWSFLSDFEPTEPLTISSVGWLIHDGKNLKALAPNMGGGLETFQVCGIIRIPTKCIVSIKKLSERGTKGKRNGR